MKQKIKIKKQLLLFVLILGISSISISFCSCLSTKLEKCPYSAYCKFDEIEFDAENMDYVFFIENLFVLHRISKIVRRKLRGGFFFQAQIPAFWRKIYHMPRRHISFFRGQAMSAIPNRARQAAPCDSCRYG